MNCALAAMRESLSLLQPSCRTGCGGDGRSLRASVRLGYLVLAVALGPACTSTPPESREPNATAGAQPCPAPFGASEAQSSERYPVVELRRDLGESLLRCEKEAVLDAAAAAEEVIELRRASDITNTGRGDHAKSLGCYKAEFSVSGPEVVRSEDRAGVARDDNLGRTFPAIVRLSNSDPKDVSDFRSATTGIAIKVLLDPATHPPAEYLLDSAGEQDFVAGGLTTFVSRNIEDYAELFRLRLRPYANVLRISNRHPEAFIVFGVTPLARFVNPSPNAAPIVLENEQFWSLLPYAWGDSAVKYRFERCHAFDRSAVSYSRFDNDYQSKVVSQFLKRSDICYVMKIQKRPHPKLPQESELIDRTFPMEDATVYWPEPVPGQTAPAAEFREVARMTIKRGSEALSDRACEGLAFNPWNGLKAHQPLGSLSRSRLVVYRRSEAVRTRLYRTTPQ